MTAREDATTDVRNALREVRDPEIDVTLADLGVLRSVDVVADRVSVVLAPTRTACPGRSAMERRVRDAVAGVLPGAAVEIAWRPGLWRRADVTARGERGLRTAGYTVGPPAGSGDTAGTAGPAGPGGTVVQLRRCPYCDSIDVASAGRFSGSVCKTPFTCRSCGTAFDELGPVGGGADEA